MFYDVGLINGVDDLAQMTNLPYGTEVELTDGSKYLYCYTALTSLVKGGLVCYDFTGGAAATQNPRATVPVASSIAHKFGRTCKTTTAAGGVWVQTYGRCDFARVDGDTDVPVGAFLKGVTTKQYAAIDHATVATASACEIAEEAVTAAIADQTDTTNGDATATVFITGNLATVA
jgi:hypothetical protein